MSASTDRPVIVVPGKIHPHVVTRLSDRFEVVTGIGEPAAVTADLAERAIGIALQGRLAPELLAALPKVEIVGNFGVGYDGVDTADAAARGVVVTHTPDVLNEEVADTTIGLLLSTLREFSSAERWLRAGRWVAEGVYRLTPLTLRGRTVGLYGIGRIGQAIARRLEGFGVTIAYHSRTERKALPYRWYPTLLDLAAAVDTLVVIVPGTEETRHTVNAEVLKALGPTGVLINVGRGTTVDEPALIEALRSGTIAAAGLDVFEDEPHVPQSLIDLPNAVLLPHVGSASVATREAMADLVADNILNWFDKGTALTPVPETPFTRKA
ncbi:2-hydroxyacid dehydrogenase [Rhizobium sp. SG2393]|uniref:2-hydroxyacid dehydrogenase n=1 Tax=Rhizobium sp. SG2393 TaxID=3276279 RepID=UPI00366D541E